MKKTRRFNGTMETNGTTRCSYSGRSGVYLLHSSLIVLILDKKFSSPNSAGTRGYVYPTLRFQLNSYLKKDQESQKTCLGFYLFQPAIVDLGSIGGASP